MLLYDIVNGAAGTLDQSLRSPGDYSATLRDAARHIIDNPILRPVEAVPQDHYDQLAAGFVTIARQNVGLMRQNTLLKVGGLVIVVVGGAVFAWTERAKIRQWFTDRRTHGAGSDAQSGQVDEADRGAQDDGLDQSPKIC